jgi:hypothetical protein
MKITKETAIAFVMGAAILLIGAYIAMDIVDNQLKNIDLRNCSVKSVNDGCYDTIDKRMVYCKTMYNQSIGVNETVCNPVYLLN